MRRLMLVWVWMLLTAPAGALEVGDTAPDFELRGSDGKIYRLGDFVGKVPLVLAWYPQAFTSGCTMECKSFAEQGHLIRAFGVSYFMVSVDSVGENERFAREMDADFPLLSDPTKATARAYQVLHQDRFAFRTNFYIDQNGTILRIDRNVDPETAAQDVARNLEELGFQRTSGDALL